MIEGCGSKNICATLPDANVPDAQMSARAPTIKTGDFASVSVRSIMRTSLDRPFANTLAGEEPWADIQSY
jgi:hypothetical protein